MQLLQNYTRKCPIALIQHCIHRRERARDISTNVIQHWLTLMAERRRAQLELEQQPNGSIAAGVGMVLQRTIPKPDSSYIVVNKQHDSIVTALGNGKTQTDLRDGKKKEKTRIKFNVRQPSNWGLVFIEALEHFQLTSVFVDRFCIWTFPITFTLFIIGYAFMYIVYTDPTPPVDVYNTGVDDGH